ncbi:MAG: hypothetical protein IJ610_09080 [Bacteroidaceae bacterium]|nr:hypothetical protein [Bacteroidaceae bacterium]
MKIKSLLSFFVPAAMMSLAVAGCSDYDNGYSEQAIKFAQDFRKTFGDIDPEQDWNLAERQFVTVSTQTESEVKIYAKVDDAYAIVGDYEGIKGTRTLGYDVVEGTTEIIVSDGKEGIKTTANGVVVFGQGTRGTAWEGTTEGVTVTKLTGTTEINGVTYPGSKSPTDAEIKNVLTKVPEYQYNISNGGIYSDFHYTSTGSFIIYPYYWNTSSINTVGIYYTDKNGEYHEVDIYTADGEVEYQETYGSAFGWTDVFSQTAPTRPNDWGIKLNGSSNWETVPNSNFHMNGWSTETDASGLRPPFIEYWKGAGNALGTAQIEKTINAKTFEPGKHYLVMIEARLMNESGNIDETGSVTFYANDASIVMTSDAFNSHDTYNGHSEIYSDMDGTKRMWVRCKPDSNGKIKVGFNLQNIKSNWFAFNNLKVFNAEHFDADYLTGKKDNFYSSVDRGQGIRVDIPEGVTFGMYVKKTDTKYGTKAWTLYSEKQKNKDAKYNFDENKFCYASTFYMGDQMFIGLEDWPNGDCDLNDFVLAFDGCKPIIINEDPKTSTWLVACEDLGGSFDIDYNDVVFSVEHISGKTKAKLTPLAAGGTLASYIYFQDPFDSNRDKCFGEIHQLFGATKVNSGEYTIINAQSRYEKTAAPIEFDVAEDWSMAYYATGDGSGSGYTRNGKDVNMGGFEIRTLTSGSDAPFTLDINSSAFSGASKIQASVRDEGENVPYILCIPYPYTRYNYPEAGKKTDYVWAWPVEYMTICDENGDGPYPDFRGWVQNHNNNTDWYKNKNNANYSSATVEDMILSTGDMTQEEINANNGGGGTTQKQTLNLGNKGSITVKPGTQVNLFDNLTNYVEGTYTFTYSGEMGSGTITNPASWTPYNEGRRTITFTREADDTYEEATTSFTFIVTAAGSNNNDWTTLTNLGSAGDQQGSTSYTIAELLTVCGSASGIDIKVEGDDWGAITLIPMTNDNIAWGNELKSSSTTITVSKSQLQSWQNNGYNKVLMQNPSSSVQAKPAQ